MKFLVLFFGLIPIFGCSNSNTQRAIMNEFPKSPENGQVNDTITLGAGCFWCVEAAYLQLKGVLQVKSGYCGGSKDNPTYKEVCSGNTGHAEVVQIQFDNRVVSVATILEAFFAVHDPTQLNRQGNDIGTQYRSVIFYHNEEQRVIAEKAIQAANESGEWKAPLVTELKAFETFYPAEDYHDNYYNQNKEQPYCSMVITPKMDKFKKRFHDLIKD